VGVFPVLGLGNIPDITTLSTENPSPVPYLDAPTQVGSEADLPVPEDVSESYASVVADSASDLLTSTSSSLNSDNNLVNDLLDSPVGVGATSQSKPPSPGRVSACTCGKW
jgi:hypothetical protein